MAKRTPNYIVVLLLLVAATVVTYWARTREAPVLFSADLGAFPKTIGHWKGTDAKIDPEIREAIGADVMLDRAYVDETTGDVVNLLIVYRKYGRRGFVHRPEMCFPAAGYELSEKGRTMVPFGGKSVEAVRMIGERNTSEGTDRQVIVYWFASGRRTEADYIKQQLWMALDRLKPHKYGWAFIRLTCPVRDNDKAAMTCIRSFLNRASDPLITTLTGSDLAQTHDAQLATHD